MTVLRTTAALLLAAAGLAAPSFQVANDQFMLDGAPIILRSGSLHYHRLHPTMWADRIQRMKAMGLNAIQTYVTWNWHDNNGVVDFSTPSRNISAFLQAAADQNMLVMLRAGPYVCGETDGGGMPARLFITPGLKFRTNNTVYLGFVDAWWKALFAQIKPFLRINGGPIAMVQPENEFGSYGNTGGVAADKAYMRHLRDLAVASLGPQSQVQLYTTDGGDIGYLSHGALPGEIFATGDGNGPPGPMFAAAAQINPPGWRANTSQEFYPGWLTHWGEQMANTSAMDTAAGLSAFLALNASFDLYMAYGGTNWGFYNGANGGGTTFQPVITSYDYDAPIQEGGGHGFGHDGDKFNAIRTILAYWFPSGNFPPEPPAPAVTAYGKLSLSQFAPLWGNQDVLSTPLPTGPYMSMEAAGLTQGYALYVGQTKVCHTPDTAPVTFGAVSDFATVFGYHASTGNATPVGLFFRPELKGVASPAGLWSGSDCAAPAVLLENFGHVNYGHGMDTDVKGFSGLAVGGTAVPNSWQIYPLALRYSDGWAPNLHWATTPASVSPLTPAFYKGTLVISGAPTDTYMTLCGWGKGQVWVNGEHIGRYWDTRGPQHTLYVPAVLLHTGNNEIMVFEVNVTAAGASVDFVTTPDFGGAKCAARNSPSASSGSTDTWFADPSLVINPAIARAEVLAGSSHALARERAITTLGEWRRSRMSPPSSTLAVGAAAPAPGACAAPVVGTNLTLQPCTGVDASAVAWTLIPTNPGFVAGRFSLSSASTLCIGVHGVNPDTNTPNLALVTCVPGDRGQDWLLFEQNGGVIMSPTRGTVIDVANNDQAPGTRLELYSSNGGYPNQHWNWDASSGRITTAMNGFCIAAC